MTAEHRRSGETALLSPDGRFLAIPGERHTVLVLDASTNAPWVTYYGHQAGMYRRLSGTIKALAWLKVDEGWKDQDIVAAFDICQATVTNVCKRYAEGGLEAVLHDKVQQRRRQALTGLQAAHLIAVACSPAPDGHDHWTVRLLANKAVELGFVTNISPDTIHQLLKKTS